MATAKNILDRKALLDTHIYKQNYSFSSGKQRKKRISQMDLRMIRSLSGITYPVKILEDV